MHLTETEQDFLIFLFEKKEEWICFQNQKIYQTYSAWFKAIKKFELLKIIKSQTQNNGNYNQKYCTISKNAEIFGEWFKWINSFKTVKEKAMVENG